MARSATRHARVRRPRARIPAPAAIWMRDDRSLALVATLVGVAILRVVVPGFFDYTSDDTTLIENGGSIGNQIIWLSLVLIPLILLRNRIKLTWMLLTTVNGWFLLLTLYAFASMLWSIDPGATSRRLAHLIGLYVVCITVCLVGWNARRFQAVLRPVLTALMVGSIIFGLVRPDLAIAGPNLAAGDPGGHWRGLTIHKNALGSVSSFAAIRGFTPSSTGKRSGGQSLSGCLRRWRVCTCPAAPPHWWER
jgi:exopolysaccharide production protein ExoQ